MAAEHDAMLEALLEASAEELYEGAPCGYFSTLPDGRLVRVNRTLLEWTGYGREELVDRLRVQDVLAPGDRIWYETHFAPLLQMQEQVREIAVELVCADGSRLPALVNATLKRGEDGLPRLIHFSVFDASDRRRYERELLRLREDAENRARAALALAHVNEGVLLVDADGRVELADEAAEAIPGVSGADAAGTAAEDAIPGWRDVAHRIPIGRSAEPPTPATLPLGREGAERWISVAGLDSGDGVVYTIRDVTVEREVERLRDDLVSIVSHELRTPLAGAAGAAQTLLRLHATLTPEQREELLQVVVDQSARLAALLDQMLLSNRLARDEVELAVESFDAAALAREVVAEAGDERVTLDAPAPVQARGDAERTRQVLGHLLDNALKYGGGTPVRVSVRPNGRRAHVAVADEGPGIPPGERERIFERFHRLDPHLRRDASGTGLGLYVARELVERMEGRIGLEPSPRGAVFFFELPLA